MQAFITLLSTIEYLPATILLNEDLKRVKSKYPLVIAVTDNIYDEVKNILNEANCLVEKIHRIEYSSKTIEELKSVPKEYCSVLNTASKIELFQLVQYDKLIYLDADVKILQNIDDLFDYPDGSMLTHPEEPMGGISSLIIFTPKNHFYSFYKEILQNTFCLDGDLFAKMWFQCRSDDKYKIPYYYMVLSSVVNSDNYSNFRTIHINNQPKPWHKNFNPKNIIEFDYVFDIKAIQKKYGLI